MRTCAAAIVAVGMATGCKIGPDAFACTDDASCGAGGKCEPGFSLCSFLDEGKCGPDGRAFGDLAGSYSGKCVNGQQPSDGGPDAPPDARLCFGTAPFTICLAAAPTTPLTISTSTTIDATNSPMCVATVSGGTNYCVVAATTISIDAVVRATGTKPLVLLASDSISITTNGVIDVGSHRGAPIADEIGAGAEPVACVDSTLPGSGGGTNGGGAGGSFGGMGGTGSSGGKGGAGGIPGASVTTITELRGGCAGQGGQGPGASKGAQGHGGGAVFLIAGNSIDVQGTINAAGEGGAGGVDSSSGGGGGGAGGLIGFDALTITASGLILANGGGGGEGSDLNTAGNPGADPSSTMAAFGGLGAVSGGDGGDGSAGPAGGVGATGNPGSNTASSGGGGGGGGAGIVLAPASANLGTNVSPRPTLPPT